MKVKQNKKTSLNPIYIYLLFKQKKNQYKHIYYYNPKKNKI